MNSSEILSTYMNKLVHPLKEIRERALKLLIAKLQLGWKLDDELSGTRQLLDALLSWFDVEKPTLQQEALQLLLNILKTKAGSYIVKEYGVKEMLIKLNKYKNKIDEDAVEIFEDVVETLKFLTTVQSQDNFNVPCLNIPSLSSSESDVTSHVDIENLGLNYQSSKSSVTSEEVDVSRYNITKTDDAIKVLLFPWAELSPSDAKTITLIEDALKLFKSTRRCCRFIRDVFLRDFPAEIFLNRPTIVKNLLALVDSKSGKISESLNVLLCITKALRIRLKQLSSYDLMHQPDKIPKTTEENIEDTSIELEEIISDAGLLPTLGQEDILKTLRQLPAPLYALDSLTTILSVLAKSVVLEESAKHDVLDPNELNICIRLVECLVELLLDCVSEQFWCMEHSTKTYRDIAHKSCMVMRMLGDLLTKYSNAYVEDSSNIQLRVSWVRVSAVGARLLAWCGSGKGGGRGAALAPAALVSALQAAQLDPALDMYYPQLAENINEALDNINTPTSKEYKAKYKELTKLFSAMDHAVTFIKNKDNIRNSRKVIRCIKESLPILELNLNENFLNDIAEVLLKNLKDYELTDSDWSEARYIALTLMANNTDWIKCRFYALMGDMVKSVFVDDNSDQSDSEKCLSLLFDVAILTEICCHGLCSDLEQVQSSATEIMLYFLRGRLILSEGCWWRLLASLLPTLPLLHPYAAHDTALGQAICKSLEMEIASCMGVSRTEVLNGLVRLLFVKCPSVQMDAAHALCHMLDDPKYLPPKESLRADVLISALRRVEPEDFAVNSNTPSSKMTQTSGLVQMLEVLRQDVPPSSGMESGGRREEPPTLEPALRRATLQQLSVLMLQSDLHDTFLQMDGLNLVVDILRMSLLVDDFLAFPECAISCISILNSVCYTSRHILSKIPDLPALIFRAVLIFPANESLVQWSCQWACACAWAGFALRGLASDRRRVLALPAAVVRRVALPFHVQTYWDTSANAVHSSLEWVQSSVWCGSAVRVRWWRAQGCPAAGRVSPLDVCGVRALCPLQSCSAQLLALQNATAHAHVNNALAVLDSYTFMVGQSTVKPEDLASLPWGATFARFLTAPPASPRDIVLLTSLLKFITNYMDNVPSDGGTKQWIKTAFIDSGSSMISLLSRDQLYPQQTQQDLVEVTQLHIHIVNVIVRIVGLMKEQGERETPAIESLLNIMVSCLEKIDLKNFHMLGYLTAVLCCIRWLLSAYGHSLSAEGVCGALGAVGGALRAAGGGGRRGGGCRLHAQLAALHAVRALIRNLVPVQRWSEPWSSEVVVAVVRGARGRRADLRASSLQLMAALAHYADLRTQIQHAVADNSLSHYAASVFAEKGEANLVRSAAAGLLTALTATLSPHTDAHEQDILESLRVNNFIESCLDILVEFTSDVSQNKTCFEPNIPIEVIERQSELEVRSRKNGDLRISTATDNRYVAPPPTLELVEAMADILYNVIGYSKCPLQLWNEQGLFRLLFRVCVLSSRPSLPVVRALSRAAAARPVRHTLADCKQGVIHVLHSLTSITQEDYETERISAHAHSLLLLSTLLGEKGASDIIWTELRDTTCSQQFFHLLLQSLEFDDEELQNAGLYCTTRLVQSSMKKLHFDKTRDSSWIDFLDNVRSPYYDSVTTTVMCAGDSVTTDCQPEYMIEEMCQCLLKLYQNKSIEKNKYQASEEGEWSRISSCVCRVWSASARARRHGLHRGADRLLLALLQGLRDRLALTGKTADVIRNTNSNPILTSLYWVLTAMSCLMLDSVEAKDRLAAGGLAVSLARLWPWTMMTDQLRAAVMHLLLVYTNGSALAVSSMCSCVCGRSVLGEVCGGAVRAAGRRGEGVRAALRVAAHCAHHHHCRAVIIKSDILSCINKLRVSESYQSARAVTVSWARLAEGLARQADGAGCVLALGGLLTAPATRTHLMPAIAHAAHFHRNLFLQNSELLELLSGTLLAGDTVEVISAARAVWALAANNHRAKLALRSAGVSAAVRTCLERLSRAPHSHTEQARQLLVYTDTVLHTGRPHISILP